MKTIHLTQRPTWQALENHYQTIKDIHLRNLFDEDPQRGALPITRHPVTIRKEYKWTPYSNTI